MIGLLFDVRPPTATDSSVSLVLLAIVIAALAVALLLGFVVLLKFMKKRRTKPDNFPDAAISYSLQPAVNVSHFADEK